MDEQQEREAFEAWLQECHPGAVGVELIGKEENSPHTYVFFGVNKQWRAWQARAALEQLRCDSAKAVPAGWKLVPVEPTTGMLVAGNHCQPGDYSAKLVWQSMLKAADRSAELSYLRPLPQDVDTPPAPAQAQQAEAKPLHITVLVDWLAARYRAAGGKEGITDLSAFCEEVMRWTEAKHGIGSSTGGGNG